MARWGESLEVPSRLIASPCGQATVRISSAMRSLPGFSPISTAVMLPVGIGCSLLTNSLRPSGVIAVERGVLPAGI